MISQNKIKMRVCSTRRMALLTELWPCQQRLGVRWVVFSSGALCLLLSAAGMESPPALMSFEIRQCHLFNSECKAGALLQLYWNAGGKRLEGYRDKLPSPAQQKYKKMWSPPCQLSVLGM